MTVDILLLGNPLLWQNSSSVFDFKSGDFVDKVRLLKRTLDEFRWENGFGRGIAAPQIGISQSIIALNLGESSFVLVNPVITGHSVGKFSMWDDCMSFPHLMIRLERYRSIDLKYQDDKGIEHAWNGLGRDESELVQHEVDHLNGILAIDRAIDSRSIIYRSEYEKNRKYFDEFVEYSIPKTIKRPDVQ